MSTERFRLKFMFWLDANKPDEYLLTEVIDELKQERSFSRTIRDGIRLIVSLRQRRTDVLFSMFPWLQEEIPASVHSMPITSNGGELQDQLQRIEKLILQTGTGHSAVTSETTEIGGLGNAKALSGMQFATPVFDDEDDDDIILDIQKDSSNNSVNNFLNSLMSL